MDFYTGQQCILMDDLKGCLQGDQCNVLWQTFAGITLDQTSFDLKGSLQGDQCNVL